MMALSPGPLSLATSWSKASVASPQILTTAGLMSSTSAATPSLVRGTDRANSTSSPAHTQSQPAGETTTR